jgi:hypothetical protein
MTNLKNLSTQKLVNIIHNVAGMALVGCEYDDTDKLCDAAHDELNRRFEERGEFVRLSNKVKSMCGPAYICGKVVDGITISTHYEHDAAKAKSYRRVK